MKFEYKTDENGVLWRKYQCDCGYKMFRKNLKTDEFEILVRRDGNDFYKKQTIRPMGAVTANVFACPNCKQEHIIADIKETVGIAEEIEVN